jgi:hypothetical protein
LTPIFAAQKSWRREDTDSFWGPAVHWNTHLQQFVMLLNRSCCSDGWPQEGIYLTFAAGELDNPASWESPRRILRGDDVPKGPGYYPQFVGLGPGETDSFIGGKARFFIQGVSVWEAEFVQSGPPVDPNPEPDPPPPSLPIAKVN